MFCSFAQFEKKGGKKKTRGMPYQRVLLEVVGRLVSFCAHKGEKKRGKLEGCLYIRRIFLEVVRVRRLVLRMHEPSIKARLTDFFFSFFLCFFLAIRVCLNYRIVSIVSENIHKYTRPMIKARLTDFFLFFIFFFIRVSQLWYTKHT